MSRKVESCDGIIVTGEGAGGVGAAFDTTRAGAMGCLVEKYGFPGIGAAHIYVAVLRISMEGCQGAYLLQTGPQIDIRES